MFSQGDQFMIDFGGILDGGDTRIVQLDFDFVVALEFIEHIQTSASPASPEFIRRVGDILGLFDDETRNDQNPLQYSRFGDVGYPAVDNG